MQPWVTVFKTVLAHLEMESALLNWKKSADLNYKLNSNMWNLQMETDDVSLIIYYHWLEQDTTGCN